MDAKPFYATKSFRKLLRRTIVTLPATIRAAAAHTKRQHEQRAQRDAATIAAASAKGTRVGYRAGRRDARAAAKAKKTHSV